MLKSLLVQNFQAHEKLRIDFDSGVTTIVGPSDVGKSAVIRALRWVCQNTPQGTAFIREGAAGCTVKLVVDGKNVVRKRARSGTNEYAINDREFRAFGQSVPDSVRQLLNVDDVNFQGQHDASFWLSLSAGEVSRQLNAVVDLTIIDSAVAAANSRLRVAAQTVDVRRDILRKAKKHKESVQWVSSADVELRRVELLAATKAQLAAATEKMRGTLSTLRQRKMELQAAKAQWQQLMRVRHYCSVALDMQRLIARGVALYTQVQQLKSVQNAGVPDTARLTSTLEAYNVIAVQVRSLRRVCEDVKTQTSLMRTGRIRLKSIMQDLQDRTQGRCPVCEQPLPVN